MDNIKNIARYFRILNCMLIYFIFFPFSSAAEEWLAACEEYYPPYNYSENGKLVGLDTEIVQHVMSKIKKKYVITPAVWTDVYQKMLDNKIDFSWQFVGTPERRELFHLIGPFRYGLDVILVRQNSKVTNWNSLNDFSGMRAGVIKGYKYHHEFDSANNFKKFEFLNIEKQIEALIKNKVDFIIGDFNVIKFFIKKNNMSGKLKFLPSSIKKIPRYFAFSKKNKDKSIVFEHYLQEFLRSQEYLDLIEKYEKMTR